MRSALCAAPVALLVFLPCFGQTATPRHPQDLKGFTVPDEPAHPQPAASTFHDARYRVSFQLPAGWDAEHRDGVLSSFPRDVRSAQRNADVRGVAAINYNPYPATTFSGALFYFSATSRSDAMGCGALATTGHLKPMPEAKINGVTFRHGEDQHGGMCTESRNEAFTTLRGHVCLRFDLVLNTFCPQSGGGMEMSAQQLGDMNMRLAKILGSIRIDQ